MRPRRRSTGRSLGAVSGRTSIRRVHRSSCPGLHSAASSIAARMRASTRGSVIAAKMRQFLRNGTMSGGAIPTSCCASAGWGGVHPAVASIPLDRLVVRAYLRIDH